MITRDNDFVYKTTYEMIDTNFIIGQLDWFSYQIKKHTIIVLDNASVHQSKAMTAIQKVWAKRQLFIFYLPPYSPHLNIVERVWKEMKARWIQTKDYENEQQLLYATTFILSAIGKDLTINFRKIDG